MNMRLIGATTIKDIRRDMVDASSLSSHIGAIPSDKLYDSNCKCENSCETKRFFFFRVIIFDSQMKVCNTLN